MGCAFVSAMMRNTSGVKAPLTAATPKIAVGFSAFNADRKSPAGS